MSEYSLKLDKFLIPLIANLTNPVILELGVENGISTKKFLELCKINKGKLYSVDIVDCSKVSKDKNWKFIKTSDDNFDFIKSEIPEKIDVLYIDSLHEAKHVKKLLYGYYHLIKKSGFIFIDDISHLPYLKNKNRNNFYCEINNKETYDMLLSFYNENYEKIFLNFNFFSSGLAVIQKNSNDPLSNYNNIKTREFSLKNLFRRFFSKIKGS